MIPARGREDRRRWSGAVAISVLAHAALIAVPAVLLSGGGGTAAAPGPPGGPFTVSLVALPAGPETGPPATDTGAGAGAEEEEVRPRPDETAPAPPAVPPESEPAPEPRPEPAAAPRPAAGKPSSGAPGSPSGGGAAVPGASPGQAGDGAPGPPAEAPYRPPKLLAGALPLTPEESEGLPSPFEIEVRLRVDARGRVTAVEPVTPELPPALLEAVRRSSRAMRFAPARRGGSAVAAWFPMTFVYRR